MTDTTNKAGKNDKTRKADNSQERNTETDKSAPLVPPAAPTAPASSDASEVSVPPEKSQISAVSHPLSPPAIPVAPKTSQPPKASGAAKTAKASAKVAPSKRKKSGKKAKYVYSVARPDYARRATGPVWQTLGLIAELLFTAAAICLLYIVWQTWWTGVQSQRVQTESVKSASWSDPGQDKSPRIAEPQTGEPPVQPKTLKPGDLIGQIYIPRFGNQWQRTIVEGTDMTALNEHGLGHYEQSQMPGQIGNFAAAGHRNGYGQPLGDVDKLQTHDAIVIRTKDYWYVYHYTDKEIVTPDEVRVVAANPRNPSEPATERMLTLTTCEPKYSTPTHRWISYGKFSYWAKVSDGIPQELARIDNSGNIKFINNGKEPSVIKVKTLRPFIIALLIEYAVIFLAAAVVWRWPRRKAIRELRERKPDLSMYGGLSRLQPGPLAIRVILVLMLVVAAGMSLFEWGFPWAASTIPVLHQMSNYVSITN